MDGYFGAHSAAILQRLAHMGAAASRDVLWRPTSSEEALDAHAEKVQHRKQDEKEHTMQHSTRRLLSMGTTGTPGLDALVAVPHSPARTRCRARLSRRFSSHGEQPERACQGRHGDGVPDAVSAMSTTIDALRTRLQRHGHERPTQMRAVLDEVLQQQTAMQIR